MNITRKHEADAIVLDVSGRLDTIAAPEFEEALIPTINSGVKKVIVDFAEVAYISSAGLRVLVLGETTARKKGVHLSIKNVTDDVREVFKITALDSILRIEK